MEALFQKAKVLIALFVIVNPLGALPTFLTLTRDYTPQQRLGTVRAAALAVTSILIISALAGEHLLRLFGVSLAAFRVAGGILILMTSMSMLNARNSRSKQTPEETAEAGEKESIGIVPLGLPLLAGPGSISTAIVYAQQARGWMDLGYVLLSAVVVGCGVWLALRAAEPIGKTLGRTGLNIATRLMGIILAAVAVEFMVSGLRELLPGIGLAG